MTAEALPAAPLIRPGTPADIPAMLVLERAADTAAHWSESQYESLFGRPHVALIAETGGAVQAFAVGRPLGAEWELDNIVVHPEARRRGLAAHLMQVLLIRAREQGANAVFLEVRESNAAARSLYNKLGFAKVGRRKGYYCDPVEDALTLKLH